MFILELLPGFALYRGLYEFSQYALKGFYQGTQGMKWENIRDPENGLKQVLGIMLVEWILIMPLAYYLDQIIYSKEVYFLQILRKIFQRAQGSLRRPSMQMNSQVLDEVEKLDVSQEVSSFFFSA